VFDDAQNGSKFMHDSFPDEIYRKPSIFAEKKGNEPIKIV
jgi:hypothetical protein